MASELSVIIIYGSLGGFLLAGGIILFILTYQRRLAEQQLHQKSREAAHQAELVAAGEATQARLAAELHDGLISNLSSLRMLLRQLEAIDPTMRQKFMDQLLEGLDTAIVEARHLSHALAGTDLMQKGLEHALKQWNQRFRHTVPSFHFTAEGYTRPLDAQQEQQLYRIVQEAHTNAVKHAAAQSIQVRLSQTAQAVHLQIEDDGKGFDTASQQGGMGLHNIQLRTTLLKGTYSLNSQPQQGTRLQISIPLPVSIESSPLPALANA